MVMFNPLSGILGRRASQTDSEDTLLTIDDELAALEAPTNNRQSTLRQGLISPHSQVRERALELLASADITGDSETSAALLQALGDSSPLVRWRAAHLLHDAAGNTEGFELRDAITFAVWQEQLVDELLAALLGDVTTRWVAVEALGQLRLADSAPQLLPKVRHYLIAMLGDEQAPVRLAAAEALRGMADAETVAALLDSLQDADPLLRRSVATALGQVGAKEAVVPLIARLRDSNASVRLSAADALGSIADQRALAPLIVVLADDDPWVRVAAATALGRLGDDQAAPSLIRMLEADESLVVRRAALSALGSLNAYALARYALLQALTDEDALIRRLATEQLARAGNPADRAALRPLLRDERVVFGRTVGEVASEALNTISAS
jgi:HEAT repeat protein